MSSFSKKLRDLWGRLTVNEWMGLEVHNYNDDEGLWRYTTVCNLRAQGFTLSLNKEVRKRLLWEADISARSYMMRRNLWKWQAEWRVKCSRKNKTVFQVLRLWQEHDMVKNKWSLLAGWDWEGPSPGRLKPLEGFGIYSAYSENLADLGLT